MVAGTDLADSLGCGGAGGHRAQLRAVGCEGGWNCRLFLGSCWIGETRMLQATALAHCGETKVGPVPLGAQGLQSFLFCP